VRDVAPRPMLEAVAAAQDRMAAARAAKLEEVYADQADSEGRVSRDERGRGRPGQRPGGRPGGGRR
jgi:hypothetical protein